MQKFADCINLSDELKQVPIPGLVVAAKSVVNTRRYSQSRIRHYNERFNDLKKHSALFGAEKLSEDFIAQYIEEGKQRSSKLTSSSVQRKTLLNLVATAVNSTPVFAYKNEADSIQAQSLRENLNAYEQHLKEQAKRKETVKSYFKTATNFLLYLERTGKTEFSKVTATDIRDFITELSAKWSPRSMRIVPSQLKNYLVFAGVQVDTILFSSFRAPRKSKPVRAMNDENVEALWKYVEGDNGDLRSKAIVTMLLATGMRPVDIIGLMLEDIDWRNNTVGFVQRKTGEYMNFELFPSMGSAIARYITEERPKGTGERNVFLTTSAPYRKLSPSICNRILQVALKNAGIAFVADGLHCPRAVRRSLVSRMIAKGIPVQKAAAAIGHVDEKSIDLYTELDVEKMKSTCLPIPTPMEGWRRLND